MESLLTYGLNILHATVHPINCVAGLGSDVLQALGHFAQCVGGNLTNVASVATNLPV